MDLGLTGKVALVTGASAGLGHAVAAELVTEGADVMICSRDAGRTDDAVQRLRAIGRGRADGLVADLRISGDRDALVRETLARFGRIDILVINSGGPPGGPFESHPRPRWMETAEEHLGGALDLVHGVLPGMRERGWGRILTVTSIAVKQPIAGLILSNTVRAAVTGFARTLANEVAGDGITVNNLMPGYTRTERVESLSAAVAEDQGKTADEIAGAWVAEIPMRRLGDPREFAALAAFLASERASYITGTSIPVDGGWIRSLL